MVNDETQCVLDQDTGNGTDDTANSTDDTANSTQNESSNSQDDQLVEHDDQAKAAATIIIVLIVLVMVVSIVSAIFSDSSVAGQGLWALVNHFQLIILIPLLGTYLENDFKYFIHELEFVSFDFDFIDFIKFPFIDEQVEVMDYIQPDKLFRNHGTESGSFFNNHYGFFKMLLIIFILNILLLLTFLIIFKA